eukprot:GGOE01020899.1.p1 GENE.GGOE01020899.1~~GGOE01020899.1.p1  ORF type:complete len:880 (-),score=315.27 GGOE01020899.1:165-2804(-)
MYSNGPCVTTMPLPLSLPPAPCVSCVQPQPEFVQLQPYPVFLSSPPAQAPRVEVKMERQPQAQNCAYLQEELLLLRQQLRTAQLEEERLQEQVVDLSGKLRSIQDGQGVSIGLRSELQKLQGQLFQTERKLVASEEHSRSVEKQLGLLEHQLLEAQHHGHQVIALTEQVTALEMQLAEARVRIQHLLVEQEAAQQEVTRLSVQLSAANEANQRLQEESDAERNRLQGEASWLKQQVAIISGEREQARGEAHSLQEQLQQAKMAAELRMSKAQAEFDAERTRLRLELTSLQQSLALVTGDRDAARGKVAFFEEQLDLARQQAEQKLGQVRAEFEVERAQLRQEIASLQQRLSLITSERDAALHNAKFLEEKLAQAKAMADSHIKQVQLQLEAAEAERVKVTRERDEAQESVRALERKLLDAQSQISTLEQQALQARAEFDAERARLQEQITGNQKRISTLEIELDTLRTGAWASEGQIRELTGQLAAATQQLVQLQQQLASTEAERVKVLQERDDLQSSLRALELQLQEARNQVAILEQRTSQAQASFDAERAQLQEQITTFQFRITRLEDELEGARNQLKLAEGKIWELNEQLDTATLKAIQSQGSFDAERAQLQGLVQGLQGQLSSVQRELEWARTELQTTTFRLQEVEGLLTTASEKASLSLRSFEGERIVFTEKLNALQIRVTGLERERDEARKEVSFWQMRTQEGEIKFQASQERIRQLEAQVRELELEIRNLRVQLQARVQVHSQTNVKETYKVKTFEMAAKLAVMDGTDDGMYNDLPIEVEGEGLYRDLVAKGRRPLSGSAAPAATRSPTSSMGLSSNTSLGSPTQGNYLVASMEVAATLSRMNPSDDGTYKGLPIEVKGRGLYRDLRLQGAH